MSIKKIALIEDDKIFSKIIYEELSELGFEVLRAYDGEEGLILLHEEKPDLTLLDLMLPKKDGYTVLKEMKQDKEIMHIPVIVLTNMDELGNIAEAIENGAHSYFVKSQQNISDLIEIIRTEIEAIS